MILTNKGLSEQTEWNKHNIKIFNFDRTTVTNQTKQSPNWIHFGAGNIFRAFPAAVCQKLIENDDMQTGIIVTEGFDYEILDKINTPHDNLSLLVTLKANGTTEKTVIGSIVESLKLNSELNDFSRLKEIFASPSLQMASFTITEKGYKLTDASGNNFPDVENDFKNGPSNPISYIGKVAALCYHRFVSGKMPIAMVSMDNCSHNGTMLLDAVKAFALAWIQNGFVENGFMDYISNPEKVSFPWSMIDKITPRPDPSVQSTLENDGLENAAPIVTSKNTFVSIFVNAEETEYLVIEDAFPNGRPPLEKGGILFTQRETVDKVEKMKVCTCLNPLHTALSIFGCILGHTKISDEMKDLPLLSLVKRIGYIEGLPVVVDPEILSPKEFLDTVINVRLPNPFMPDTPQRIATDTSQKLSIRFGETIKAYKNKGLDIEKLQGISLTLAGWCRYLMGIDDDGNQFELSSDPMLNEMVPLLSGIQLGECDVQKIHKVLSPILSNTVIFGVNLYDVGMGNMIEQNFVRLIKEPGAVRGTLIHYMELWQK